MHATCKHQMVAKKVAYCYLCSQNIRNSEDGIEQAVERYGRYLENRGFRPTTIRVYSANLRRYLKFAGTDRPSEKDLKAFQERLFDRQEKSTR